MIAQAQFNFLLINATNGSFWNRFVTRTTSPKDKLGATGSNLQTTTEPNKLSPFPPLPTRKTNIPSQKRCRDVIYSRQALRGRGWFITNPCFQLRLQRPPRKSQVELLSPRRQPQGSQQGTRRGYPRLVHVEHGGLEALQHSRRQPWLISFNFTFCWKSL